MVMIQMLQVAAQVLKEHSLQLCHCPPRINFSPKEAEFVAVRYELRVDAPWKVGFELTSDCAWRLIDLDLHEMGVRIAFKGRWDGPVDEAVVSHADLEPADDDEDVGYGDQSRVLRCVSPMSRMGTIAPAILGIWGQGARRTSPRTPLDTRVLSAFNAA